MAKWRKRWWRQFRQCHDCRILSGCRQKGQEPPGLSDHFRQVLVTAIQDFPHGFPLLQFFASAVPANMTTATAMAMMYLMIHPMPNFRNYGTDRFYGYIKLCFGGEIGWRSRRRQAEARAIRANRLAPSSAPKQVAKSVH